MVLEQIFPNIIKKRFGFAFLIGFLYSLVCLFIAILIFPNNPTVLALGLSAILILPSLWFLFSESVTEGYGALDWRARIRVSEELAKSTNYTYNEKKIPFDFKRLYRYNKDFGKIYLLIFFGVFFAYAAFSLVASPDYVSKVLSDQMKLFLDLSNSISLHQNSVFSASMFTDFILNNIPVLLLCFIISFIEGNGAVLIIIWNASVWGTIFGVAAKGAAISIGVFPILNFCLILALVFPHLIMEASAYVLAAISGGLISRILFTLPRDSPRFRNILVYSFWLLFISLVVLLVAAVLETFVFSNTSIYQAMILQSFS